MAANAQRKRRIAVLGSKSVGKSSLTMRFTQNTFSEMYVPTIEDTLSKEVTFRGQRYVLEITDTAGQESGSPASSAQTLNVDGWVLVFSTANRKSFEYLRTVRNCLLESTGHRTLPMVLVGNKVDLAANDRTVGSDEVTRLAQEWQCPAVLTSAKTNQNVQEVFDKCLYEVEKLNGNIKQERNCCIS
ncbi:hypothetical protein BOX15_Mlig022403g1 [Macrostomum lignano]|nr:hypothetical protein BOX15_Mlig028348g1 [Macrostomum lignano]PAA92636.1 hypothetical protein BOX15_Mlig022403g1 [Macrostomum lignano]